MAIKNSDELKMKAHDIQKSEYGIDVASAARYPQMSAEAKWQKNLQLMYATDIEGNKVPKNNPTPMNKPYEASLGVQAKQVLYAFDKISEPLNRSSKVV
jgi:outer membrane protein TolC